MTVKFGQSVKIGEDKFDIWRSLWNGPAVCRLSEDGRTISDGSPVDRQGASFILCEVCLSGRESGVLTVSDRATGERHFLRPLQRDGNYLIYLGDQLASRGGVRLADGARYDPSTLKLPEGTVALFAEPIGK